MKEVPVRTKPKDSFTLVLADNSDNIQTTFSPPLYLQAIRDYELALAGFVVNLFSSFFLFFNTFLTLFPVFLFLACFLYNS